MSMAVARSLPRSLLGQFVLLHVVMALGAAMTLTLAASALLHQTADHYQRGLLRRQAAALAASIRPDGTLAGPVILADGMAIALIDSARRLRDTQGPVRPGLVAAASLDGRTHFLRHRALAALVTPVRGGWLVVSQDDSDPRVVTDDIVQAFLERLALLNLPIIVLGPTIGMLLARRLTVRMRKVSAIAAEIGPRALDLRLPLGALPLEAEPLALATNAALDRLRTAFHAQSAFAADIAHELRTPLAVIRVRADAIEDAVLRATIMAAVDRAGRVIGQLLALAELERPIESDGVPIDLHALAEAVVADRAPAVMANGRTIALERSAEPAIVTGYAEPIAIALENLVDNAVRHTPPGTAIVVSAGPGGQLRVQDDGDAVPDEHLAHLKKRFWRADGARTEGSGIGLSIVDRIAGAHHGVLRVGRNPDGRGLVFTLLLDATTSASPAVGGANA
jgi:signal transduction histidine kinase